MKKVATFIQLLSVHAAYEPQMLDGLVVLLLHLDRIAAVGIDSLPRGECSAHRTSNDEQGLGLVYQVHRLVLLVLVVEVPRFATLVVLRQIQCKSGTDAELGQELGAVGHSRWAVDLGNDGPHGLHPLTSVCPPTSTHLADKVNNLVVQLRDVLLHVVRDHIHQGLQQHLIVLHALGLRGRRHIIISMIHGFVAFGCISSCLRLDIVVHVAVPHRNLHVLAAIAGLWAWGIFCQRLKLLRYRILHFPRPFCCFLHTLGDPL